MAGGSLDDPSEPSLRRALVVAAPEFATLALRITRVIGRRTRRGGRHTP